MSSVRGLPDASGSASIRPRMAGGFSFDSLNKAQRDAVASLDGPVLILAGAALFYLLEAEHILKGVSWQKQLLDSFFQSITPRTAGFNTVDIGGLHDSTSFLMMALMWAFTIPMLTAKNSSR